MLNDATLLAANDHPPQALVLAWARQARDGCVCFDATGKVLYANPAAQALLGSVPAHLDDANDALRHALGWPADLGAVQDRHVLLPDEQGTLRTARVLVQRLGDDQYVATFEDKRDAEAMELTQQQYQATLEAAGVGWPGTPGSEGQGEWSMEDLFRQASDQVHPDHRAAFDNLHMAWAAGSPAQARYIVEHPLLGTRWLMTGVRPVTLSTGRSTQLVVTIDVTDQELTRQRNAQLLRELMTLLESTTTGIAYLRKGMLLRCNERFERMLNLAPNAAGHSLQSLLASEPQSAALMAEAEDALRSSPDFEAEIEVNLPQALQQPGRSLWYSVAARRLGDFDLDGETVVIVSNISRLKHQQQRAEALARERARMYNVSGVGIALIEGGQVVQGNEALAALLGVSPQDLSGLALASTFEDEATFQRLWPLEEAAIKRDGAWSGERVLLRQDGERLWVQVSKQPLDADRPCGAQVASYVNVDARHQAEQALALQAQRNRDILNSVLVGIVTVDARGGIEWLNRSARRMFGGALADFLGQGLASVATEEADHPFRRSDYADTLELGAAHNFECRVHARDGRTFWVVGNVVLTLSPSGARQLTFALLDIHRRREAETSLQRVIDMAPMAIVLRDARTLRVIQVNQVGAETIGRSRSELIGTAVADVYPPDMVPRVEQQLHDVANGIPVGPQEFTLHTTRGLGTWETRYTLLHSSDDSADQILGVSTDVTEQRATQQARLESEVGQRDMLVREVHHRIKNNLQGVAGLLQQIATRKPEVGTAISEVVGQVHAIAQVYGLQVGGGDALRLVDVTQAIVNSVRRLFGREIVLQLECTMQRHWTLPEAESIPVALTINELLTNAIKHGVGPVSARVIETIDELTVEIRNAGHLPEGFNVSQVPSGVSGLGLIRALLPRRNANLELLQEGEQVVTRVTLGPPNVKL